uniref:Gfo/Idh/MocA-like oxidoreductase N-terminal domain-containing protein n=1 Tax=viral metagenome TaxID=1070528 RepID=A0A6C0J8K9_9ZZZZ
MKISIALIGSGYWGKNFLKHLTSNYDKFNFIGLVEKNKELRDINKLKYKINVYENISDIIDKCDNFIIATPVNTHFEIAKYLLENKKNIMVEKPLTENCELTKILVDLSIKNNCKMMCNFTPIYTEPFKFIKNYLKNKKNKIRFISLRRSNLGIIRKDCNVIIDLTCHDIALLYSLTGILPKNIKTIGKDFYKYGLDMVSINLEYEDFLAYIYTSRIDNLKQRELVIITEDERITYDDTNTINPIVINKNNITNNNNLQYNYNDTIIPNIPFKEPLKNQLEHFYNCITKNEKIETDGEFSLNINKIIQNI